MKKNNIVHHIGTLSTSISKYEIRLSQFSKIGYSLFFLGFLLFSNGSRAQNNGFIAEVLGQDPSVSQAFINGMSGTVNNYFCDPPCKDTCDPWDDNAPCPPVITKNHTGMTVVENSIKRLESEISRGHGGSYLGKELVSQAKKKFPGSNLKALKNRMDVYLQQLKKLKK